MKVRYLATAPGQAAIRCKIDVVVAPGIWSGVREYTRGEEYLVSDALGAALLGLGGFEIVEEKPAPKRRGGKE